MELNNLMYRVFKFGGASIKDAASIVNVCEIINSYKRENLIIVFSAIGKVTNQLEKIVDAFFYKEDNPFTLLDNLKNFHLKIVDELFNKKDPIYEDIDNLIVDIQYIIEEQKVTKDYSYIYDQIVSIGEFLSTKILSAYLHRCSYKHTLIDIRDLIRTDNTHRNAKVDWHTTTSFINTNIVSKCYVTQGFIGCTSENFTTTLGREGSDFTAAILAFALEAKDVVIWKDVPGMMNADPNFFNDSKLIDELSFDEAIELAYYGAKVIHPKTIQPLKKKGITLHIKSFKQPLKKGTLISNNVKELSKLPFYINKQNQILISISDSLLSFIVEEHISKIFKILEKHSVRVNMMQNSAISFSICVDNDRHTIAHLLKDLQSSFKIYYNKKVSLYTIRNYNTESLKNIIQKKKLLLEQRSRNTIQLVIKD